MRAARQSISLCFLFSLGFSVAFASSPFPPDAEEKSDLHGGNSEIFFPRDRIIFSGFVPKYKTADPRSLGGAHFLTNSSSVEYRVTRFDYSVDESGLLADQSAETDIGMTILSKNEAVSLDSGKELMVTHQYDAAKTDRGLVQVAIPLGGFALHPGQKLSVGSVSTVSSSATGVPQLIGDGQIAGGRFLQLYYRVELTRSDLVSRNSVTSYRSPFRDRSYVADPLRVEAPSTDFKNVSSKDVKAYALAVFFSDRPDAPRTTHEARIYVNGRPLHRFGFPPHMPAASSKQEPVLIPLHLLIKPGDVVSIRGTIIPPRAVVLDFASYLIADEGLLPFNEHLDMVSADLDGDGTNDIIDIDSAGSVWVSLRSHDGLQNTQLEWARDLRTVDELTVDPGLGRNFVVLRAANSRGLCLNLRGYVEKAIFVPSYCGAPLAPYSEREIWGDFNGDGWIDRMTIAMNPNILYVALGGPSGLSNDTAWAVDAGPADRMFVSRAAHEKTSSIEAERTAGSDFTCMIWRSTGSSFVRTLCSHVNN